jgi:hypothetical protein
MDEDCTEELATPSAVAVSGTYYIKAATAEGCWDVLPVTVTVNIPPEWSVDGDLSVHCWEHPEYSAPVGMTTYHWWLTDNEGETGTIARISGSTSSQTVMVDAHNTGTFKLHLTISNANGCYNTGEVLIENSKADQTITFNPLPAKVTSDPPFDISSYATSSSGLPISSMTSSNPDVATIDATYDYNYEIWTFTVTIIGAGFTVITASCDGNEFYNDAEEVEQELVVNPA